MDRVSQGVTGTIKEAMFIRVNDPSLNRNLGKYLLEHIHRLVVSLNRTCCCSRLEFTQPQLDFFRSEEKPNLLNYLLVLRCSVHML